MIEIDDKIVSADLLREGFLCDIAQCKGICCVEGNAGAPLDFEEINTLESEYENYKPYMTEAGIPYSRLHDVGGWMGGGLYVDIPNLFRDFDAERACYLAPGVSYRGGAQ